MGEQEIAERERSHYLFFSRQIDQQLADMGALMDKNFALINERVESLTTTMNQKFTEIGERMNAITSKFNESGTEKMDASIADEGNIEAAVPEPETRELELRAANSQWLRASERSDSIEFSGRHLGGWGLAYLGFFPYLGGGAHSIRTIGPRHLMILIKSHVAKGHPDVDGTVEFVREMKPDWPKADWPTMEYDVASFIQMCPRCMHNPIRARTTALRNTNALFN